MNSVNKDVNDTAINGRHYHDPQRLFSTPLTAMRPLSAAIVHEIIQPLATLLSHVDTVELMLEKPEPDLAEIRLILANIRQESLRASKIVRQFRNLSHQDNSHFVRVNLQELFNDVLQLATPLAERRGVNLVTKLATKALWVNGDAVLLQQAILNLLLNAMDALDQVPRAQAIIEVSSRSLATKEVEIRVRDYGNRVPCSQLPRLFDTFFTTKPQGSGLGLAIVGAIIEFHCGRIRVENHAEGGTLFLLTLPTFGAPAVSHHKTQISV